MTRWQLQEEIWRTQRKPNSSTKGLTRRHKYTLVRVQSNICPRKINGECLFILLVLSPTVVFHKSNKREPFLLVNSVRELVDTNRLYYPSGKGGSKFDFNLSIRITFFRSPWEMMNVYFPRGGSVRLVPKRKSGAKYNRYGDNLHTSNTYCYIS